MLLTLLMGCWMDSSSLPALNIDVINFTNEYLEADDTVVYLLDSSLTCPDGKTAPFFYVDPGVEGPNPVAVIFHSGAFDFTDLVADQPFEASGRLLSDWSSSRIWETLNLSRQVLDTAVTDSGYLPTALANAGVGQLYPSNCWGDIWHNGAEVHSNNEETEGYSRQGLDMAEFMLSVLTDADLGSELGVEFIQESIDPEQIMWIGLGSGGQAIIELLGQGNSAPNAVLFDSSPADWSPYIQGDFTYEQEGLDRIFGASSPADFALNVDLLPERVGWIWSNGDTQHPIDALRSGATAVENNGGWVVDTNSVGHVFSNRDWALAQDSVNYLLTGTLETDIPTDTATE